MNPFANAAKEQKTKTFIDLNFSNSDRTLKKIGAKKQFSFKRKKSLQKQRLFNGSCSKPTRTATESTKNSSANHYTMEQSYDKGNPLLVVQRYCLLGK